MFLTITMGNRSVQITSCYAKPKNGQSNQHKHEATPCKYLSSAYANTPHNTPIPHPIYEHLLWGSQSGVTYDYGKRVYSAGGDSTRISQNEMISLVKWIAPRAWLIIIIKKNNIKMQIKNARERHLLQTPQGLILRVALSFF